MRLTATLKGHYEWEPVPTGTPISKADEDALRVKQMADGSWRMRVPVTRPTELIVDVPEQLIARQLADKARRGAADDAAGSGAQPPAESGTRWEWACGGGTAATPTRICPAVMPVGQGPR